MTGLQMNCPVGEGGDSGRNPADPLSILGCGSVSGPRLLTKSSTDGNRNLHDIGFTTAMITIMIISTVGTSLIARKNRSSAWPCVTRKIAVKFRKARNGKRSTPRPPQPFTTNQICTPARISVTQTSASPKTQLAAIAGYMIA